MDSSSERMSAYRVGAKIAWDRIAREAPLDARALRAVEASDIVVVTGNYDQVELVLDALGMPYQLVTPQEIARVTLRPEQLLIVNCPGQVPAPALSAVRRFVQTGGSLFTTDWALRHLIEPAFPGLVQYNEHPTADDVVRIEVVAPSEGSNPFLKGVLDEGNDPLWWLEGSSYPITILDPKRVRLLISSRELESKYGESAVAVQFGFGDGEVFHMISHYYLQRTETRNARQAQPAVFYAEEKGYAVAPADLETFSKLNLSAVESAASSSRLIANIVAAKKRKSG
jgi:hypothetical protein